jgi:hypothetical protein
MIFVGGWRSFSEEAKRTKGLWKISEHSIKSLLRLLSAASLAGGMALPNPFVNAE